MKQTIKTAAMDKKVRFTRASSKDSNARVTIRSSQIGLCAPQGTDITLVIKHGRRAYKVIFTSNREDQSTFKTTSWPRGLPLPKVGKGNAQELKVLEVIV